MRLTNTVDKLVQRANASLLIGTSSWKEQFIEAVTVSSSDEEEEKEPSKMDYFLHIITLFWKIIFAFVPPTELTDEVQFKNSLSKLQKPLY
ncbi:hypothetical protein NQ317_014788 [Molorchus minor]|uniref:Uncharacterized protein n=1 Tax=Molorchus minor TaxID=1323400 RepID=A0ABQ9J8Z5_9CUCU|nr:hypothetical protein NQ317_014788 [Molorchus minor]